MTLTGQESAKLKVTHGNIPFTCNSFFDTRCAALTVLLNDISELSWIALETPPLDPLSRYS
jgi:hypothetical protein